MSNQLTPAYAFGDNEHTRSLAEFYPLLGIIDEYSSEAFIADLPRVSLDTITLDASIINCVYNSRGFSAQSRLQQLGFTNLAFVGDIIARQPEQFSSTMLGAAYLGMQKDYVLLKNWQSLLFDEQSKYEFSKVVDFRRSLDINHLSEFSVKIDEQYFDDFVVEQDFQCLIDGGAYDGHDCLQFAKNYPHYLEIKALEPSEKNRELIANKLSHLNNVEVFNACLGSKRGVVYFEGSGTAAKIVEQGGVAVDMQTIDDLVCDHRVLVKLDIEGAEVQALQGATQALNNPRVGFAISAYHLPHDFVEIFQWLQSSKVHRRYYFRHYSNGIAESVLFAI